MSRSTHKLREKMNSGYRKMNKEVVNEKVDKAHGILDQKEIGYEELSEMFLTSMQTVKIYVKMLGIKPIRKSNKMHCFKRIEIIGVLNNFSVNGRLTFDKKSLRDKWKN